MKETSLPSEEGKGKSAPKGKEKMARSSQTGKQASAAQVNPATQNTKKGPGKKTVAPSVDKPQNRPVRKPSVKAKPESLQYLFRSDMPLADWNIGGVFRWDKLCMGVLGTLMLLKTPEVKLPEFSGCPPCLWALNWFTPEPLMAPNKIRATIEAYVKEKVGVFLYFDNPFLTPADMRDTLCNGMINLLAECNPHRLNGVYVASPLLAKHVRANFPGLRIRLAANFHIKEKFRTAQWYNNLSMRYDRVALDPRDGINTELLSKLRDKKKFEITVNDTWLDSSQVRRKHLELLGKILREPLNVDYKLERQKYLQDAGFLDPKVPLGSRPLTLTVGEVKAMYDQGFRHFRLQTESLSCELTLAHFAVKHFLTDEPGTEHKKAVLLTTLLIQRDPTVPSLPTSMKNYVIRHYE